MQCNSLTPDVCKCNVTSDTGMHYMTLMSIYQSDAALYVTYIVTYLCTSTGYMKI